MSEMAVLFEFPAVHQLNNYRYILPSTKGVSTSENRSTFTYEGIYLPEMAVDGTVGRPVRVLDGKLAIVTGASRGIGAAIAEHLASKGAFVVLTYNSESSAVQTRKLASDLEARHTIRCLPVRADISHSKGSNILLQAVMEHFGSRCAGKQLQIDIIVNNAGVVSNALIEHTDPQEFEWMYRTNVLGPLLLIQAALPFLPHDRTARIVNVSSISSTEGFVGQSIYGGSKAALEAMTRTWARELASRGTVNAINPGPVRTDMWHRMPDEHKSGLRSWMLHTPLAAVRHEVDKTNVVEESEFVGGRPAYATEIAGIVGMLCSNDSAWCTGQVICANGGMRMAI